MKVRIQKWGNSLALRIPKTFAIEARIEQDSLVDVSVVDGGLVIHPAEREEYTLEDLLREATPENVHRETETGPAIGVETW